MPVTVGITQRLLSTACATTSGAFLGFYARRFAEDGIGWCFLHLLNAQQLDLLGPIQWFLLLHVPAIVGGVSAGLIVSAFAIPSKMCWAVVASTLSTIT